MTIKAKATVEDLYRLAGDQKAEIVNGEIVLLSPTGGKAGRAATKITSSLTRHEEDHGGGYAFGDNVGFVVDLSGRGSFSPDAAWYVGNVDSMDFLEGPPVFAVEIRSKNDYGKTAENEIAKKISDYFAAGTKVVWDVDLLSDDVIRVHRASDEGNPTIYRRGDLAEAEPAVAGWRFAVDELFK